MQKILKECKSLIHTQDFLPFTINLSTKLDKILTSQ